MPLNLFMDTSANNNLEIVQVKPYIQQVSAVTNSFPLEFQNICTTKN